VNAWVCFNLLQISANDLPVAKYGSGVTQLNDIIYCVGGRSSTYERSVHKFDPDMGNWCECASLKQGYCLE